MLSSSIPGGRSWIGKRAVSSRCTCPPASPAFSDFRLSAVIAFVEFVDGPATLDAPGDRLGDLLDVAPELGEHRLAFLDRPVPGDHAVEVEGLEPGASPATRPGSRPPCREEAVHQVAGRHHAL